MQVQNKELSHQLETAQDQLDNINQAYVKLQELFLVNEKDKFGPPIETRLGIKEMGGIRYPNYLWVTGQIINRGNLTLYNTKLRFLLYTANGTDPKEYILGTMQSNQIVEMRYTVFSSLGKITS